MKKTVWICSNGHVLTEAPHSNVLINGKPIGHVDTCMQTEVSGLTCWGKFRTFLLSDSDIRVFKSLICLGSNPIEAATGLATGRSPDEILEAKKAEEEWEMRTMRYHRW